MSGLLANQTTEEGSPIREQAVGWMTAGPLPLEQPFPMNVTSGAFEKRNANADPKLDFTTSKTLSSYRGCISLMSYKTLCKDLCAL